MSIEYIPFPGNKIDLSAFDNRKKEKKKPLESYLGALKNGLAEQAQEINYEFPDFLNTDGQIKMVGREASSDATLVESQEEAFALGIRKTKEEWQKEKENQPSNLMEMALTILLHKYLKKDFIVARASAYDDYNNGVDQVVIDKKSGAIICGFDEVVTHFKDGRAPKKEEKLKRKMLAGGARIKYGAVFNKQGELERASRSYLPAFYLALTKDDLNELLPALTNNQPSSQEEEVLNKIFSNLSSSLQEQLAELSKETNLDQRLEKNLGNFQASLERINHASLEGIKSAMV